uniref:Uncharacterized protein n=1 Tax=Ditylenchus dipsaci TaxID=166011 RepID=A0A915DSK4_9BILA
MRRLQQQYLQKLLRERLTRLQQPQNTNNNQQSETFGGTALQQGEANAPPGSVPNDAGSIYVNPGSIQSPAQPALGPSEGAGFNLSTFNISNLVALLGSANLSGSNFSVSSDNLESEKNNSAPASLTDQVGLKITSSSDQRLAEAIAQSRASDQAVPRPITEQQPNQQDEIPPLLPSGQIQTPINTFAGTSRTQPGVMDDRQSISNVYSNFEQVNGTSLTVPPINAATQSGSQVAGSNPAESGNSVPNNTLQAIRQQQQTAILAAIFARAASLGNTGGVAPVEAPLPNGPLQPKFQPRVSAHTAQKTSITSSQTAGGYAVPPGLVGVPTSPSAQKSAASSQSQSLSQRLKAFLASQKSSAPVPNPIQAPKPVVQPASPPNQQPLNSQIAVLQQQIRALLAQQQQLNRQSNTQQQLQRVIQVLNANSASIQPPAQSAVLTIQPQIQSQNTPVSNLQIQSLQPQNVKESIPPGYAIVQQPIYVIQQPAVSQPVSNQNVVRVNANNLRQQLLQSQRLQQLQKIQEQQQSRNSLQSIYVDSGGSSRDSTKNVGSNNYYMSGIGFDLNTAGDRTRPSTRANQGNIAQNRGQGNNLVENFQQRVEQPQRPIQIQQSRKSSQSYQQNRGSLISPSQSQFTRQPNCCVTGGIWDLWSDCFLQSGQDVGLDVGVVVLGKELGCVHPQLKDVLVLMNKRCLAKQKFAIEIRVRFRIKHVVGNLNQNYLETIMFVLEIDFYQ